MILVGSNAKKGKEYYVDGVGYDKGVYMVDDIPKEVGRMMVASTYKTGLTATPLYVGETPQGIAVEYAYMDAAEPVNITGRVNKPGAVVYCAGFQDDSENIFANPVTCQADENGVFAFEGITAAPRYAVYVSQSRTELKLPAIPDEVLAEYPYYAVVWVDHTTKYLLCVSKSPMYVVENVSGYSDYIYLPDGYRTYKTADGLTLNSEGAGTGSVKLGQTAIYACNHNITTGSGGTTVWSNGGSINLLKGRVYFWVYDEAHLADLTENDFCLLRSEPQNTAETNILVVCKPIPDVTESEGGGSESVNGGDYSDITLSGTCPADVAEVYISYADFAEGSTTEISNAVYDVLKSNIAYTLIAVDGAFSGTTGGLPYYQLSGKAKCITVDYNAYAIWCVAESGELTVTEWSVTHYACLSGDTLIRMANGENKELRLLEVGEEVLSSNGQATRITRLSRGKFNEKHTLYEFNDGTVLDETSDHRFFNATKGYWQKLKRWDIGDCAVKADGTEIALTGKRVVKERVELFGIWTESHEYYANGLLSGDVMANVKLLATATVEQIVDCLGSVEPTRLAKWMEV